MKRIAIVGYGFMGKTHYGAWRKCRGARVVAVCDANLAQLAAKVIGNIKGAADNTALPKDIRVFSDFDAMLAAGGFDIVDITLPTPLHEQTTIRALEAGFHVLCEKPMAITLEACDAMLAAAKRAQRVLLVAHCVRFFPEYAYVREALAKGTFGKVIAADFTRFMSAPRWSPKGGSWLLDESKSGGLYVDAHIHDADFIRAVFGDPTSVTSRAHRSAHGYVDHLTTSYTFDNGALVTSDCSFAASDSLLWDGAARIFCEKATIFLGPAYKKPLIVYPQNGKPFSPRLSKRSGYEAEVRYFLDVVEGRVSAPRLTAQDARAAVALVLAERATAS